MKVIKNFGEKLRELREKAGFTQERLAVQMGISKSIISQYENQGRIPSPTVLIKISAIFHVSADYLLDIDNTKRADLFGLTEKDIAYIEGLIELLREKNQK